MKGVLIHWNPYKFLGIIQSKNSENVVSSYFLPAGNIIYCEVDTPQIGCLVEFETTPARKDKTGFHPIAVLAKIYKISPGLKALSGVTTDGAQ